jgi:hypothetical protein
MFKIAPHINNIMIFKYNYDILIHQMPGSKGLRPTSPVHVHVDDDVPVHVHVKQPKKKKGGVVSYQCSSIIVTSLFES